MGKQHVDELAQCFIRAAGVRARSSSLTSGADVERMAVQLPLSEEVPSLEEPARMVST
jgi:hypothetical protein